MANQPTFKYLLLMLDALIVSAAFFITVTLDKFEVARPNLYMILYVSLFVVTLVAFRINDLYKRHVVLSRYRQLVLLVKSVVIATASIALPVAFVRSGFFREDGKDFFMTYVIVLLILFFVLRVIPVKPVLQNLARRNIYKSTLLIIGADKTARHVAKSLESDDTESLI